ncbi:hypothetical protein DEA98_25275 [Brucella pseudogrignonensis]|nr:hypothetical protein [Brucella pseudogrignonensis]
MPELAPDTSYNRASATFEVSYDASGKLTSIITVEFQPVRQAGEAFAIAAQDAILQCASQTRVQSRTIRVVLRYFEQNSNGPLIMKNRSASQARFSARNRAMDRNDWPLLIRSASYHPHTTNRRINWQMMPIYF